MTKAELIEKMLRSNDLPESMTKKCLGEILDVAFAELANYFARAKITRSQSPRFTYPGFGTFTKKRRAARRGVHPQTLEPIEIGGFDTLDFKPGVEFRRLLNREKEGEMVVGKGDPSAAKVARVRVAKGERDAAALSPSGRRLVAREEVEPEILARNLPDAPLARSSKVRTKMTPKTGS